MQIDAPASPNMRRFATAMVQNVGIVAPCFFEVMGQAGKPVEAPVIEDGLRSSNDGRSKPAGVNVHAAVRWPALRSGHDQAEAEFATWLARFVMQQASFSDCRHFQIADC